MAVPLDKFSTDRVYLAPYLTQRKLVHPTNWYVMYDNYEESAGCLGTLSKEGRKWIGQGGDDARTRVEGSSMWDAARKLAEARNKAEGRV